MSARRPGYGVKDGLVLQPKAGGKRYRAQPGTRDCNDPRLQAVERGKVPAQRSSGGILYAAMNRTIDALATCICSAEAMRSGLKI